MKCPYCNSELEPETYIALPGKEDETGRLCCPNPKCSCHCQALEPDIYELLSEGKKAQEALEIAIAWLTAITASGFIHETLQETASKALDKIDEIMKQDKNSLKSKHTPVSKSKE